LVFVRIGGAWSLDFAIPLSVAVMMMFGMFDIRCPWTLTSDSIGVHKCLRMILFRRSVLHMHLCFRL